MQVSQFFSKDIITGRKRVKETPTARASNLLKTEATNVLFPEIPYDASTCNSNWAMGCSLKRCGLSKLTPSAKPTGEETCMFCVKYERYLVAYGACASHYENDCVSWI